MLVRAERHIAWVVLAVLVLAAAARADVRDSTGLFSQNAVHQANSTIEQIHKQTGKDVIVEVFGQIPSDLKANYKPEQQAAFFNNWMRSRAQQLNVNGIYILVCRDPNYLDVGVGAETRKRAFTMEDRGRLSSMMLDYFKRKQFDQGLIEGVSFIQRTMQSNIGKSAGNPAAAPTKNWPGSGRGGGLWWGWWVLIGIGVVYLIFRLFSAGRQRSYSGGPGMPGGQGPGYGPGPGGGYPGGGYGGGYQGGYPPSGGGGGFGRGILGGLLGGAAGGWLYDKFRGQSGSAYGGSNMGQAPPDQNLPSDQGQGFEGGGGGFGDSSGDQGGGFGDSGGGDFGGGGGGDDSGGGTF